MEYSQGIYDISNEEYHESEGVSKSGLMLFKKSPLHYWNRYRNPNKLVSEEQSQSMILGSAFHCLVLEKDDFNHRYFVDNEKIDRRTSEGKKRFEEIKISQRGKILLPTSMFEKINKMADSFFSNPYASKFLENAKIEKSLFWNDRHTDILCKTRPDIWQPNLIIDLKTSADASCDSFRKSIARYGYHIQAAMAQDGIHNCTGSFINEFIYLVVETEEPYAVGIYILDQDSINRGHNEYKTILQKFKEYEDKKLDVWEGYKPSLISLPAYYI